MTTSAHGTTRARRTLRILQQRIASGEWPLNSRIPTELELAEELGVGRSTIREAVRTLAGVGMLEPARSRGTFVRSLTPVSGVLSQFMDGHAVADLIGARNALEVEAARLAAQHRTDEDLAALRRAHEADVAADQGTPVERGSTPGQFHALVLRATHNALMVDLHASLMTSLRAAMARGRARSAVDEDTRRAEHAHLLEAIAAGDVEAAEASARSHVESDVVAVEG
ncbi:MAG: FadR/GntR family transcriptional regulator [Nocardioides sp.]|uniref:FadR/GntR family transcriptional regulator n=1 Tax=Nocardioides sp. TaxID=35761 RepID=UPI003F06BFD1